MKSFFVLLVMLSSTRAMALKGTEIKDVYDRTTISAHWKDDFSPKAFTMCVEGMASEPSSEFNTVMIGICSFQTTDLGPLIPSKTFEAPCFENPAYEPEYGFVQTDVSDMEGATVVDETDGLHVKYPSGREINFRITADYLLFNVIGTDKYGYCWK